MIQQLFKTKHYRFEPPVDVMYFEIDKHYYATNSDFQIYAEGNSAEEAMTMFEAYLDDFVKRS